MYSVLLQFSYCRVEGQTKAVVLMEETAKSSKEACTLVSFSKPLAFKIELATVERQPLS